MVEAKRSDMVIAESAIRRGYPISENIMNMIVGVAAKAAADESSTGRLRMRALSLLQTCVAQNMKLFGLDNGDTSQSAVNVNVGVGVSVGSEAIGEDRLVEVADDWGVPVDLVRDALAGPDASAAPVIDTTATAGESTTEPV